MAQETVSNAVKYSRAQQLQLALSRADDTHHRLTLSDDGVGIDGWMIGGRNHGPSDKRPNAPATHSK